MGNETPAAGGGPKRKPLVHFQLARAATPTKLLITFFLLLLLLSFFFGALYSYEKTGLGMEGTRLRYQGAAEDEETEELHFPISDEELLRLTHVHTFGLAIMFYLFGHVFILTSVKAVTKNAMLISFFVFLLVFIAAPWLTRYRAGFGFLFIGSLGILCVQALFLSAVPIYEMWFDRRTSESTAD
ncbi:MAG: hypothetical protein O6952_06075 [Planctomycetota bacterium]|nr:hypothetical protein [Planctomycetota bacterium]